MGHLAKHLHRTGPALAALPATRRRRRHWPPPPCSMERRIAVYTCRYLEDVLLSAIPCARGRGSKRQCPPATAATSVRAARAPHLKADPVSRRCLPWMVATCSANSTSPGCSEPPNTSRFFWPACSAGGWAHVGAELSNRDTHTAGLMTERLLLLASHPSVRPARPARPAPRPALL